MIALLIGLAGAAERPLPCEFMYPIVGSAGYANAQAARQTNNNTYSASAYADRTAREAAAQAGGEGRLGEAWGFFSGEMNWTLGAARVPTLCTDTRPSEDESLYGIDLIARWERKERVYEQPLDLYALNIAGGVGLRGAGAFYSASVTQSVLGYRAWVLPTQLINFYPVILAPLVGNFQRGDGVASYSVDWIGGAYIDTKLVAARAGYTGSQGFYGSVDERALGLFGSAAFGEAATSTPWQYLQLGVADLGPGRLGAEELAEKVGSSTAFLRDLPLPGGSREEARSAKDGEDRLRTIHVQQRSIRRQLDLQASFAIRPEAQVYDAQVAWHSPDYHLPPRRGDWSRKEGALLQVGMVELPARYTLGVEGGRFFSARAELQAWPYQLSLLFNDPEQLALYPFATNALSFRARISGPAQDR